MLGDRTVGSYRVAALIAFIVCTALCVCTAFLLVTWTEPLLDDFCRGSLEQRPGIIDYIVYKYLTLGGRWAALGLQTLLLSTTTLPSAYPWLVFTLIVIQCVLFYSSIWNFAEDARLALYLSALIAGVYWATMPSPQEGIFWLTGAIENQLPLSLGLLLFSLVLCFRPSTTKRSTWLPTIAASALGFVTPGFHELVDKI
jgi:uncharacterized protein DUF6056